MAPEQVDATHVESLAIAAEVWSFPQWYVAKFHAFLPSR
jgi:hypothetical protein